MVSFLKLYDEGGRPAIREYLRQEEERLGITPEESRESAAFMQGWIACKESYDIK